YGGSREMIDRQALHSRQLSFFHPFARRWLTFAAPLPGDMAHLIETVRSSTTPTSLTLEVGACNSPEVQTDFVLLP
ncbi:hypothetical protein P9711_14790, partial [Anoxybacillus geothermalis]|nr:hypothetical protein [Anoxybacillus geothermalis]